jgi:hypothetical protein
MDCEKFEANLIDELYGELDDVTSAAMKRHAGGCSRCAGLLGGLRATRKIAALPLEPLPDGLEDRIFAAAREAQKVVPMRSRFSQFVSRAGGWAMRPQTAMAAVFLLAIGSSVVLMNNRVRDQAAPASAAIQGKGAPVANERDQAESAPSAFAGADNAHGTLGTPTLRPRTSFADDLEAKDKSESEKNLDPSQVQLAADGRLDRGLVANAAPPAGVAETTTTAMGGSGSGYGGGVSGGIAQQQANGQGGMTAFEAAMGDYRSRNYDEATRRFDALSPTDVNSALWAARSIREANGCGAAVARFDQVAARAADTPTGYDATLEAGRCYRTLGQYDAARARFAKLAGVPAYAARAQAELDTMTPAAAARAATKSAPSPIKPLATATATGAKPPPAATTGKAVSADAL